MKKVAIIVTIVALAVSSASACKGWKGKTDGKKDWKKSSSKYETK